MAESALGELVDPEIQVAAPGAALDRRPTQVINDPSGLTGRQKAVVLLLSIGTEKAAEIFKHLKEAEIEELSLEMARTPEVPARVADGVFSEISETELAREYMLEGGAAYAREVLERALGPERATEIFSRLSATMDRRPFKALQRTPAEQIRAFLRTEGPQTAALVIANLHTSLAAEVLSELAPAQQADVAARIARMRETTPEVIEDIEDVMRRRLAGVAEESADMGGVNALAEILNHAARSTERQVLETLTVTDADLAERVRQLLFTFEDIVKLDDRSVQFALKSIDQKDLAMALRGVPDPVRDKIFANMSERGAEMLSEEIEFMPPQRRSAVEQAQGRVVSVIRRLEEGGEIVIGRGADDDEMVV